VGRFQPPGVPLGYPVGSRHPVAINRGRPVVSPRRDHRPGGGLSQ